MRERYFHVSTLVRLQAVSWYLFALWFGAVTIMFCAEWPAAADLAFWGVVMILAVVAVIVVLIAELFRRSRLYRYWLLAYMLLVILLSTVVLKTWLAA